MIAIYNILGDDANNLSNSTLRRKLFEGAMEDECEQSDEENENNPDTPVNDLENCNDKQKEPKGNKDSSGDAISSKSPKLSIHSFDDNRKSQFDSCEKENYQYVNVNITPGAMILTPKAKSVGPTPDSSVSKILFGNAFSLILKFILTTHRD